MNREEMIKKLIENDGYWDFIIIGGGATGLGVGLDAASRGYKTLLLEQHDFSKGTSSRSTKLVHGGVRYLRQGNISLVLEALHERGLLIRNAPHLVSHQAFIVPNYEWWDGPFYGAGMKVYDLLAGRLGLGPSKHLSKEETLKRIPTLEPKGLRGGVVYFDGQFDDSRLAVNLAQTMVEHGGVSVNYMKVTGFTRAGEMIDGVTAKNMETGDEYDIHSRVVVNATGVFTDGILKMENPDAEPIITPSQGVHVVLNKEFLPGDSAIMVPQTADGRVLFAVPWHDKVVVGTTDTEVPEVSLEPRALEEEIKFILDHAAAYLTKDPTRDDVQSVFAGLRPLVNVGEGKSTAAISRDHYLVVSESGLVTITGGKWTTYRKMAEDTVNQASLVAGLKDQPCITKDLRIHGWLKHFDKTDPLSYYGSDAIYIKKIVNADPVMGEKLHEKLPYIKAEVIWAVREEMARTVEDFLARRSRALLLDARASMDAAPEVARIMAEELGYDRKWQTDQEDAYVGLAKEYLLT
ncbi:FAD-dependent oxidoreductase [Desulfobacter hydrogenophilus]|uniref:FAD-dependent oxidoreductase n=1 Tax=Desulfobacter hydrogenophilus TaxID=2291 RepID=A0A328FGX4_9BACT|nr:glycerol-3-phosphate dehydrogenase/oxidase [Desulfobacter hydrogenophilus]NDY72249.1 glycerol-3-phosphate dehydrogenase/oxidase [Desulfobacter hydrogenophilus]QBH12880.1 glycerol-3-phosphate dehydrogenase/oxidase [Desulfobacter hydrogenophilus]RAM03864.1 FAD-dependent oxidoreductase [Desulfobacter hydrogenophilus]